MQTDSDFPLRFRSMIDRLYLPPEVSERQFRRILQRLSQEAEPDGQTAPTDTDKGGVRP